MYYVFSKKSLCIQQLSIKHQTFSSSCHISRTKSIAEKRQQWDLKIPKKPRMAQTCHHHEWNCSCGWVSLLLIWTRLTRSPVFFKGPGWRKLQPWSRFSLEVVRYVLSNSLWQCCDTVTQQGADRWSRRWQCPWLAVRWTWLCYI